MVVELGSASNSSRAARASASANNAAWNCTRAVCDTTRNNDANAVDSSRAATSVCLSNRPTGELANAAYNSCMLNDARSIDNDRNLLAPNA